MGLPPSHEINRRMVGVNEKTSSPNNAFKRRPSVRLRLPPVALNSDVRPLNHMNQSNAFFLPGEATDPAYVNVRDEVDLNDAKAYTEALWTKYRHLADPNFLTDAKNHFLQRFWEMYVACSLIHHGFDLHRVGSEGPEFYFLHEGRQIWVEAIAPGPGNGPDRVPEIDYGEMHLVPTEKILLRFTSALREKNRQYHAAIKKGILQQGDSVLLAVNCRGIPYAPNGAEMPYIVKAFLPFGALAFTIGTQTDKVLESFNQFRPEVRKENSSPVATTSFLSPEFASFVAVLHSAVDCANYPDKLGGDFMVLHNPSSTHPLSTSVFSWCRQYQFSDQTLHEVPQNTEV